MKGEATDQSNTAPVRTAPHPVLKQYYESESERQPFVSALFDSTAMHYDWVCWLGFLIRSHIFCSKAGGTAFSPPLTLKPRLSLVFPKCVF